MDATQGSSKFLDMIGDSASSCRTRVATCTLVMGGLAIWCPWAQQLLPLLGGNVISVLTTCSTVHDAGP